jgi:acyl-CoA hydrolase
MIGGLVLLILSLLLGTSVDVAVTAVECAKTVIAQVNPQMPRTHGDGLIHISCIGMSLLLQFQAYSNDYLG